MATPSAAGFVGHRRDCPGFGAPLWRRLVGQELLAAAAGPAGIPGGKTVNYPASISVVQIPRAFANDLFHWPRHRIARGAAGSAESECGIKSSAHRQRLL